MSQAYPVRDYSLMVQGLAWAGVALGIVGYCATVPLATSHRPLYAMSPRTAHDLGGRGLLGGDGRREHRIRDLSPLPAPAQAPEASEEEARCVESCGSCVTWPSGW